MNIILAKEGISRALNQELILQVKFTTLFNQIDLFQFLLMRLLDVLKKIEDQGSNNMSDQESNRYGTGFTCNFRNRIVMKF